MFLEKECIYEVETETADLNERDILKPHAYQQLFARVVDQHLNRLNLNVDRTMKNDLAWVLVSLSFELSGPVTGCAKIFAHTWYSERRGPYFRREVVFWDAGHEELFKGSTFSVLLDMKNRTIFHRKELPFTLTQPIGGFTVEASPTFKTDLEFCKVEERRVHNSYIDCIGHVNNCRYGEFAYDAFTDEERENLNKLKRMDFYFLSELRGKDTFSILKTYQGSKIFIRGRNDTKAANAFDVVFEFSL